MMLVHGVCFQVAHEDPVTLAGQWAANPTFQALQDAARVAQLAFIQAIDRDQGTLIVTVGQTLVEIVSRETVCIVRNPCGNFSPAVETIRTRLRVFIVASGHSADEEAGLVLLAPRALWTRENAIDRQNTLDHQLDRLTTLIPVERERVYEPHGA